MTEKAMRCVKALRICHSNEDCRDCEFMESDRDEKSCVNILFEDAADLIESLSEQLEAAQPKWISVEERMPEPGKTVQLLWKRASGKREVVCGYRTLNCRGDLSFHIFDYNIYAWNDVTHWMSLSEPLNESE